MGFDAQIKPFDTSIFALNGVVEGAALIRQWSWHNVRPNGSNWDDDVRITKASAMAVMETLQSEHSELAFWVNVYGPFVGDGVIGAAAALIDMDGGSMYYVPEVASMSPGPGYLYSFLNVQYNSARFNALPLPRCGLVGGGAYMAIVGIPADSSVTLGKMCLSLGGLFGQSADKDISTILSTAVYLLEFDHDFDSFLFAARRDCRRSDAIVAKVCKLFSP